jgi:dihydrolipoamide dehydrogenase
MTVNHAQMQARVAVGHILNEAEPVMKPLVEAVYTYLPIGQLGDTAESEDGLLITKPYSGLLKAQMEDATNGLLKVKIDKHSGRILGAAAFGPNAIELLSLLQIAMHAGITWKALRQYPLPHPTYSELLSKL